MSVDVQILGDEGCGELLSPFHLWSTSCAAPLKTAEEFEAEQQEQKAKFAQVQARKSAGLVLAFD